MNQKKLFLFILFVLFTSTAIYSQSDLHIFGFYQVNLNKIDGEYKVTGDVPTLLGPVSTTLQKESNDFLTSGVQQLNLFARKEITSSLTSFINIEMVNNFSTENNWGSFKLEEAWLSYNMKDYFNIQAGWIIPRFNYMNEIKNKTPLLPSVIRPLVYESAFESTINASDYLPEVAFVQISGVLPVNKLVFDYAVYAGPAESNYFASSAGQGAIEAGHDTTNIKLFGGRAGLKFDDLRLGVSFSMDKDNQVATLGEDVKRTRFGVDAGYNIAGAFAEAEYISVALDPENTTRDLNKSFMYGLVGYNFSENFYGYGIYSYIEDKAEDFLSTGLTAYTIGMGYRPTFGVVVKLEYANYFVADDAKVNNIVLAPAVPPISADIDLDFTSVNLALSVMF